MNDEKDTKDDTLNYFYFLLKRNKEKMEKQKKIQKLFFSNLQDSDVK